MGELIRLTEHGLAQSRLAQRRRMGWQPLPHPSGRGAAFPAPDGAAPECPIDLAAARLRRRIRHADPTVVRVQFGPADPADSGADCGTFRLERRPRITGRQNPGMLLCVETGSWAPEPERLRYRWYRDGHPIHRATGPRYRVDAEDRGARLSVKVTAVRGGFAPRTATATLH